MIFIKTLTTIYFLILSVDIYAEISQKYFLVWIFKPLLMPILLLIFFLNSDGEILKLKRRFFIVALVFSWLGDIFLLQPKFELFILGLISFLVTHLCYISAFFIRFHHESEAFRRRWTFFSIFFAAIPFLVYIVLILSIFYPRLNVETDGKNRLLIPVVLYTFVIVTMSFISFLRDRKLSGFYLVFFGAILFVLSDSFLALNKFVLPLPTPAFYVMSTYGLGQYLITIGVLRGTNKIDRKHFSD